MSLCTKKKEIRRQQHESLGADKNHQCKPGDKSGNKRGFGDAAADVLEYLGFVICDCARDFSCAVKSLRLCLPQFPTGKVGIKQNILSSLCLLYLHNLKSLGHCFYFCYVYCLAVSCSLGSLGIFHNIDNKFNRFSLSLFFYAFGHRAHHILFS